VERYHQTTLPLLRVAAINCNKDTPCGGTDRPTRIPRTIHFIWLGEQPIPSHFKFEMDDKVGADWSRCKDDTDIKPWNACMSSWLEHHPPSFDWTIRLWTETEVKSTFLDDTSEYTMTNRVTYEYALSKQNYGLASDILRLELLSIFGGVYADIDYLCLAPLDDLHSAATFYCGASNVGCVEINNGLMASAAGHTVVQRMMKDIGNWFEDKIEQEESETAPPAVAASAFLTSFLDAETTQSLNKAKELMHEDVIRHSGPGLITRVMIKVLADPRDAGDDENNADIDRIMVLPAQYFHSLPNDSRAAVAEYATVERFCKEICGIDMSRAVHLWGCSWQK